MNLSDSRRDEFDTEGRLIARIYDENPKHRRSWRKKFDAEGREISRTYAENPEHPGSWRKV